MWSTTGCGENNKKYGIFSIIFYSSYSFIWYSYAEGVVNEQVGNPPFGVSRHILFRIPSLSLLYSTLYLMPFIWNSCWNSSRGGREEKGIRHFESAAILDSEWGDSLLYPTYRIGTISFDIHVEGNCREIAK